MQHTYNSVLYDIDERWGTRKMSRGSSYSFNTEYIIKRHDEAEMTELNALATIYDYLDQNSLLKIPVFEGDTDTSNYMPLSTYEAEQITYKIWNVALQYGWNNGKSDSSTYEVSFDTGGGSQKVTQTVSPLTVTAYGDNAPNFQGAINVDDNSVNGVDIVVPVYNFTLTRNMKASQVTSTYRNYLMDLTGKINNSSWYGFAAGEVLFLGASGSKHGRFGKWEMAYKFAASPNKTNITIGSINGISKKGWQYLWVRYEKNVNQNTIVKVPKNVYVHDVYESGNFTDLGVGQDLVE